MGIHSSVHDVDSGSNPDLVSGGAPTNGTQNKPTGTTASSAITFQAPTGGSGASSPSVALSHVSGSGASLSGSGLGGYTVGSLADGDVVTVTCDHTDSGDGQIITDVAVVSVAAPSGADLSALPLTTVDLTDGTWVSLDPDSLVKSVAESSGNHTVTMNALGSGSTNYAWSSGSTMRGARWYIPLIADNAAGGTVRITTDDTFVVLFKMVKGSPSAAFNTEIVVAGCIDPTGLTSGTIVGMGGIIEYTSTGNPGYGAWAFLSKTSSVSSNNVNATVAALWSGRRAGTSSYVILKADGTYEANGQRASNSNLTASTDMFLMVGVGTRGATTIADDDNAVFKLEYRVVKLPS